MSRRHFTVLLSCAVVVSMVSLGAPAWAPAQQRVGEAAPAPTPIFVPYRDMKWQPLQPELGTQGAQIAIVRVDPKTQATQLMLRLPPRFHVRAHYHSANESHMVIQGSFLMGHGDKVEELGPGGYNLMPARMIHEAWSGPGNDTVVFVTFDGPFDIQWTQGPSTADDLNVNLPKVRP